MGKRRPDDWTPKIVVRMTIAEFATIQGAIEHSVKNVVRWIEVHKLHQSEIDRSAATEQLARLGAAQAVLTQAKDAYFKKWRGGL